MRCLHLVSDSEYGTHVYYECNGVIYSYFTEFEKLQDIIEELKERHKKSKIEKKVKGIK